jgi:hypothetical protein
MWSLCCSNCNKFENVQCLNSDFYVGFHLPRQDGVLGKESMDKSDVGLRSTVLCGGW